MKPETRRKKRISSLLQEALSRILIEELQGVTSGVVTVTRIDVPADLKSARVYLSVFGTEEPARVLAHLEKRTGFLRKVLASTVKLKYNPMLIFLLDPSAEFDERIDQILQSAKKDGRNGA